MLRQLTSSRLAILDGGMGHELLRLSIPKDRNLFSLAALINPDLHPTIRQAHTNYMHAGCDIITTNNYSVTPLYLSKVNKEYELPSLTRLAVNLAVEARYEYLFTSDTKNYSYNYDGYNHTKSVDFATNKKDTDGVLIAGSVPPLSYSYCNDLIYNKQISIDAYCSIIENLLINNKIDFLLAETLSGINESIFIIEAMNKLGIIGKDGPDIIFSFSLNNGLLHSGEKFEDVIDVFTGGIKNGDGNGNGKNGVIGYCEDWHELGNIVKDNLAMLSINCTLPEAIDIVLDGLKQESINKMVMNDVQLGLYPNGFHFVERNDKKNDSPHVWMPTREDLTDSKLYHDFIEKWINNDKLLDNNLIGMIGGCCSVFPKHIKYMVKEIKKEKNVKQLKMD